MMVKPKRVIFVASLMENRFTRSPKVTQHIIYPHILNQEIPFVERENVIFDDENVIFDGEQVVA